jgi:hypothetical protein
MISIFQASTLRDRYYTLESRVEILETAIDDIERINGGSNQLIARICDRVKTKRVGTRCDCVHDETLYRLANTLVADW